MIELLAPMVLVLAIVLLLVLVAVLCTRESKEEADLGFFGTDEDGELVIGWYDEDGRCYSSRNPGELAELELMVGRSLRSPLAALPASETSDIPLWEWPMILLLLPFVWLAMKLAKTPKPERQTKILSGPGYAIEVDAETEEPVDILWHQSTRQVMDYPPKSQPLPEEEALKPPNE